MLIITMICRASRYTKTFSATKSQVSRWHYRMKAKRLHIYIYRYIHMYIRKTHTHAHTQTHTDAHTNTHGNDHGQNSNNARGNCNGKHEHTVAIAANAHERHCRNQPINQLINLHILRSNDGNTPTQRPHGTRETFSRTHPVNKTGNSPTRHLNKQVRITKTAT